MDEPDRKSSQAVSRRAFFGAGVAAWTIFASGAKADPGDPALAYMRLAAKDLLLANRQGTVASFLRAIQRHADIPQIAIYSLGQYKSALPESQRVKYYRGVATFMSRYFADQSREYRVAKYELGEPRMDDQDVLIASKVYLLSGQVYTVTWRLAPQAKGYKISDAKVLGFSLVYLQRGLFTSYLSKRNGDINQLVAALNQQ